MVGTCNYGDVTYYEQLGVARNAPPEAIRHAYRSLVRLLHPDQQTDPDLKAAAERQLRKLNRIHSVLIDPEQRRAYDRYLADESQADVQIEEDEPKLRLRKNLIRAGWVVGAIATVVLLFLIGSESTPLDVPAPAVHSPSRKPPAPAGNPTIDQAKSSEEVEELRRQLNQALTERDEARREADRLRSKQAGPARGATRSPFAETVAPAEPAAASARTASGPVSSRAAASSDNEAPPPPSASVKITPVNTRTLAGSWFYVPPRQGQHNKDKALYPPEFIEMSITEENGNLKGRYRARYRISDRPISPDVNFEISGKATGGLCACSWRGIGGARGQINLQLTGANTMRFDWTAAELGNQQGLASGTAVLSRRADAP